MAHNAFFAQALFSWNEEDEFSFRALQEEQDNNSTISEYAPEDVDSSDAGWSTDFVLPILALLFLVTSYTTPYPTSKRHFRYMHVGTAIAHLFGGFAHAFFPNRASDGTGMIGFYISMILGYSGNCMRYGLGWGLPKCWAIVAGLNFLWLFVAGIVAIVQMEQTRDRVDSSDGDPVLADSVFGYGEILCAVGEIAASIAYVLVKKDKSWHALVAMTSNLIGWVAVYAVGLWAAYSDNVYDTRITQLLFHYMMIPFLWAINEIGVRKEESESRDDANKLASSSCIEEHEEGNEESGAKTFADEQARPSSTNEIEMSVEHGGSNP